ncbi:hypothetical protein O77CONTIG1_00924 [Leptolyngbya sp. O-77]|nr:hypothetical protein O77CONTIG1_00924 [Leptolyngbya sp. O-77]
MASRSSNRPRKNRTGLWLVWLDAGMLLAWGGLMLRFWLTGRINILLHPDYVWLAIAAGFALLGLGVAKLWEGLRLLRRGIAITQPSESHANLLPPGWSSALLLAIALFGLQFTPRAFASQVAIERGVADTLTLTRSQPQSFRTNTRPEDRSLIDWVRLLNVYPEPDAYTGQKASVEGFVIHSPNLPSNYFTITRFVITCCAADVYPVGLPVRIEGDRTIYEQDQWLRVEGNMATETLDGQRQLVIQAASLTPIEEPQNPYDY